MVNRVLAIVVRDVVLQTIVMYETEGNFASMVVENEVDVSETKVRN